MENIAVIETVQYNEHTFMFKRRTYLKGIYIQAESKEGFLNCTLETGFENMSDAKYAFEQNKNFYIEKLKSFPGF